MKSSISFFLNGEKVTANDPHPELLLIDYLRSSEVRLTGAKKGCGQGGCGACTVILSKWNDKAQLAEHKAINACLRPVCSLEGLAVTTIEGTGAVRTSAHPYLAYTHSSSRSGRPGVPKPHEAWLQRRTALETRRKHQETEHAASDAGSGRLVGHSPEKRESMNPVAYRLAANNGTQCGYCTTGFVMNMSAFLAQNPNRTKREIEDVFDGNICRCTGYRAILTGMKTFATDWTEEDEARRMKCRIDDAAKHQLAEAHVRIPFPDAAKTPASPVSVQNGDAQWLTPPTIEELVDL
ncbi:MAG: 2Fe-2S iron-sulfur cluster binding domain-containing protein, partial [Hyphomicrobiales bacterium]|nr:2Fe-2S iron-sulfur cluster binding domain-containing protein [Hyphomicrobiales bacterium]